MVKIALQMKCLLDNIEELIPKGPEFKWYLKFTCTNCGQTSDKWHYLCLNMFVKHKRGNGVDHYVNKCKFCLRENSVSIIENSISSYTADDNDFKTIVVFDCRGIEPCDFFPKEGWTVQPPQAKMISDVNLSDGEWGDYCVEINRPVGIFEIEHKFVKIN